MSSGSPCGACKFLRRKCVSGCIFAPYFGTEQGVARFAAVHKVFGASNVSKLLLHIPTHRRHEAVVTVCYEAQARLSDPVYGCVSTIFDLQQQVGSLQTELAMVQSQLANAFHHQQQYNCNNNNTNGNTNYNNIGFLHHSSLYDTDLSSTAITAAAAAAATVSNILSSSSFSTGTASCSRAVNNEASNPSFHGMPYELELSSTLDNLSSTHPNYIQPEIHDQAPSVAASSQDDDESNDPADIQAFTHSIIRRKL